MIGKKIGYRIWIDVFAQFIVDHADRRGAAAGQTFHEFDANSSILANENWLVKTVVSPRNASSRAKVFHNTIASGHRTTKCPTNADVGFGNAFLPQHRIEGYQLENVDQL